MGDDLIASDKPTLERCVLRYFLQGDYDLVDEAEYFAISLFLKSQDLVEIVDSSDPREVADVVQARAEGKIKSDAEFEAAITELGRENAAKYIVSLYNAGIIGRRRAPKQRMVKEGNVVGCGNMSCAACEYTFGDSDCAGVSGKVIVKYS